MIKKTIIFRFMVKIYDAYHLWRQFVNTARKIRKIPAEIKHFFIFPFYHTGGAEKIHVDIVKANHTNQQVVFFTGDSYNDQFKDDFYKNAICLELFTFLRNDYYKKKILQALIKILNKKGANWVFSSQSEIFYAQIITEIHQKNKCIDLIHAFVHEGEPGAEHWSLPVVEKLFKRVTESNIIKNKLFELYDRNNIQLSFQNKIDVIGGYVDINENFDFTVKEKKHFIVLYVGRYSSEKRVEFILELAIKVTKIIKNDISFYFIGPGMEELRKTNSNNRIRFTGYLSRKDLISYYKSANIILLLSSREGIPVVLMEAMASGIVPISTGVGGVPEIIEHQKNGFLIENYLDKETLISKAMEYILLLSSNRGLLNEVSKNAYLYAKNNFSKNEFINKYKILLS